MRTIFLSGLLLVWTATAACAGQANVFVYHRFGDARYPSTNIALDVFAAQLELLRKLDYTVLPLSELAARLKSGEPLPERCAALTVDDAYDSFLTGAMPLLRRYGYPASLFVSTDSVGGEGYLGWDELRALRDEGVEIGNHSASHPYLLDRQKGEDESVWKERIRGDIERASTALRRELGGMSPVFAYPYGEYAPEVTKLIAELGFSAAVTQRSGVMAPSVDPYALPRFPMGGRYATLAEFREKLAMCPLEVRVVAPASPVVGASNPPELTIEVLSEEADLGRLRCFIQGQGGATVQADPQYPGRFRVRARQPLAGRRNHYTLTAPGKKSGWFWFSQLWVFPQR